MEPLLIEPAHPALSFLILAVVTCIVAYLLGFAHSLVERIWADL